MQLKTNYKIEKIPFPLHPTPQCERESWQNLNGEWNLKKLSANDEELFDGRILVPFSPETVNSGIGGDFTLEKDQTLIYERWFSVEEKHLSGRTIIHFGAVDSECEVFINGTLVGRHIGGFTPFSFDVGSVLDTDNKIIVKVKDNALYNGGAKGKQHLKRGGIWYTPQSGIYQTVWLEFVPKRAIGDLKITPILTEKKVVITFSSAVKVKATVYDNGKEIISSEGQEKIELNYDFELWSPENPKLYDLILTNGEDKIKSYFGMRSFEIVEDKKGKKRLGLNGKPYFYNGVLDQGYWSDGMLTYPSDDAVYDELKMLKSMGFNTVRKHIKLEPMRWYYYCDKLGLAVWQDFVNGGTEYSFMKVAALPFLGFKHDDSDYKYFGRDERSRKEYIEMVKEIVGALYNCVSLAVYVPFNEGWGQFDSAKITQLVQNLDGTRMIDSVSGWYDQGEDKTLIKSLHTYYTPLKVPNDKRPVVLSEFGGYSYKIEGHVFNEKKAFGYKFFKSDEEYVGAVKKLYLEKLLPLIEKGLSGAIYTQVSDVEDEINGFVTYDRKVQKMPTNAMREINDKLKEVWKTIE